MPHPTLYIFSLSHYCEKARWALDRFGIEHRVQVLMPGLHRRVAVRLGAAASSMPFLSTAEVEGTDGVSGAISGSGAIIDWGEAHRAPGAASLAGTDAAAVRAIEERLDAVAGVHVRRFYYSTALFEDPAAVRPIFMAGLPWMQKLALRLAWGKIVPMMINGMDLGPAQGEQSRAKVMGELDWLDGLLADGRRYLVGDSFSRADLTAASLLAALAAPPQHPTYAKLHVPAGLEPTLAELRERPVTRWVGRMYAEER